MVSITNVAIAYPPNSYGQQEIFEAFAPRRLFWHYFSGAGIAKRHLCYPPEDLVKTDAQTMHDRYSEAALQLSLRAVQDCLARADLAPRDIDMMSFSSSTGFTCPGLEHFIAKELKMREDIVLTSIVGMGCGASGPALRRVSDYARLNPGHKALCVMSEITNAGYHPDKDAQSVAISNAIFADGAAAILLEDGGDRPSLSLRDFVHVHDYEHASSVAMVWSHARLRLALPRRTSEVSTPMVSRVMDRLLGKAGLRMSDVAHLIIHSGGASILKEAQELLQASDEQMKWPYYVWRNFGNMSSATAPFALHYLLQSGEVKLGDWVVMVTLGAGFEGDGILMSFK
ncbi:MAG: hypothetical protein HY671_10955 [Chloroflexi bacterium]|nr:hypothetical protein [Chloroflexota bacterium]